MFSLSHWTVVGLVIAAIVAVWKFERKGRLGRSSRHSQKSIQRQLLKLLLLVVLIVGALTPAFGLDAAAGYLRYIHLVCTLGLAAFAYMGLFPKGDD